MDLHVAGLVVVTGGPGAGKTTLLAALARSGYASLPEAGRAIIRDQRTIGGAALPWADRRAFAELMLSWDIRSYGAALERERPMFFDRGIPDVAGYLRLIGEQVPAHVDKAARLFRYHRQVFVAPPWPEIYAQDGERRQNFAEAERTCAAMVATYADYGYEALVLPRAPVAERVGFILGTLGWPGEAVPAAAPAGPGADLPA